MLVTKQFSLSAVGSSAAERVEGAHVHTHLLVACGATGNGANIAVDTSMDGSHWTQLFTVTAGANTFAEGSGPAAGTIMRYIRVTYFGGGTSTATIDLTVFED